MATGDIWDQYQNNQYSGTALDAAMGAAAGQKAPTVTTSGNQAWQNAQSGNQQQTPQSYFPSVASSQFGPAQMTSAMMYPAYQALEKSVQQNTVPIGGFGLGFGYGSQQSDLGSFLNQSAVQPNQIPKNPDPQGSIASAFIQNKGNLPNWSPQEWMQATGGQYSSAPTSYQYRKGTGGVSGGNDSTFNAQWDQPPLPQPKPLNQTNSYTFPAANSVSSTPYRYTSSGVPDQKTNTGGLIPGIKPGSRVTEFPSGGMSVIPPLSNTRPPNRKVPTTQISGWGNDAVGQTFMGGSGLYDQTRLGGSWY